LQHKGRQDIHVYVESDLKGTFHPSSGNYAEYSTANFTTTAGSHVVKFVGLNPLGGDHTAFIDNVVFSIQWDQSPIDNTRKISVGPAAGLGVFHFRTTTPVAVDFPVTVPVNVWSKAP